jgi:AcrR family transcriptional regulator
MGMQRPYRGVAADDRRELRRSALLEAALECLGDDDADISVRRVCAVARLTPRYFYESFTNLDELQLALLTQVADEIAAEGAAAVAERAPTDLYDACRTAFEGAYSVFQHDPRKARAALVVASGTDGLMEARRNIVMSYADSMLAFLGHEFGGLVDTTGARVAVLYAVGGALEVTHAVLNKDVALSDGELVDLVGSLLASSVQRMSRAEPGGFG